MYRCQCNNEHLGWSFYTDNVGKPRKFDTMIQATVWLVREGSWMRGPAGYPARILGPDGGVVWESPKKNRRKAGQSIPAKTRCGGCEMSMSRWTRSTLVETVRRCNDVIAAGGPESTKEALSLKGECRRELEIRRQHEIPWMLRQGRGRRCDIDEIMRGEEILVEDEEDGDGIQQD